MPLFIMPRKTGLFNSFSELPPNFCSIFFQKSSANAQFTHALTLFWLSNSILSSITTNYCSKCHVALYCIEQLRQLINAAFADEFSKMSNPWIVCYFKHGTIHFIFLHKFIQHALCVHAHTAKLIECKLFSQTAYSFLFENRPSVRIVQYDDYCSYKHQLFCT